MMQIRGQNTVIELDKPTVYVVVRDDGARDGLKSLMFTLNVDVKAFDNAEAFLEIGIVQKNVCLIADVDLPGINGIELLEHLNREKVRMPTILLASNDDVSTAVRAMRAGVVDYIEKPFVGRLLVNRIRDVLD